MGKPLSRGLFCWGIYPHIINILLMLKLKLQYFGHLMPRADSFEKTLMLGKIEGARRRGDRGWDGWMASLTQWTWVWVNSRSWWWTGGLACCGSWGRKESDTTERLNWLTFLKAGSPWTFRKPEQFSDIEDQPPTPMEDQFLWPVLALLTSTKSPLSRGLIWSSLISRPWLNLPRGRKECQAQC